MKFAKLLAGIVCILGALTLLPIAVNSFFASEWWFKLVPICFIIGLIVCGVQFLRSLRSAVRPRTKIGIAIFLTLLATMPVLLVHFIRAERRELQSRAQAFMARPIPLILRTNDLGGYIESRGDTVLTRPIALVKRYAEKGRIRWSARIQGEFAGAPFGLGACEDVAKTNEQVRLYVAECKSILDEEWRMGYWQWVEDTIEFLPVIPEHAEEDERPRATNSVAR